MLPERGRNLPEVTDWTMPLSVMVTVSTNDNCSYWMGTSRFSQVIII